MIIQFQTKRAFTLIEVLVVVAIIALLVAILLPSLAAARRQANIAACASNLRTIGHALIFYCEANKDHLPAASAGGFENLHKYLQKITKSSKQLKINTSHDSGAPFADVDWYLCPGDEIYHLTSEVEHKMPDGTMMNLQYRLSYAMNEKLSFPDDFDPASYDPDIGFQTRKMSEVERPSKIVSYCGAGDDELSGQERWVLNESNDIYNQTEFEVHHKTGNNFLYCDTHVSFHKVLMKPPQYGLPPFPWAWAPNYQRGTIPEWDDFVREEPIPKWQW